MIKKIIRFSVYTALLVIVVFALFISYIVFSLPNVGKPEVIKIELTPERIARGKYLANNVTVCMDCHSTRDWTKFAGPLVPGTLGKGGEVFNQQFGFPGNFISKNITPAGIGSWTDGEVFRAITTGVDKDGKALFPVMPHPHYGTMDREDIYSIIAYIRTLAPIDNVLPASKPDFPMNIIIHSIPQKAIFTKLPPTTDQLAYGKYLFNAAACGDCHTKQVKGKPIVGMELAGGFEFPLPSGGVVSSANITPDPETGIGSWTEANFVGRFKAYADTSFHPANIEKGNFNSVMPWNMYGHMKDEDLKAIYAYLRTIRPIHHPVVKFVAQR